MLGIMGLNRKMNFLQSVNFEEQAITSETLVRTMGQKLCPSTFCSHEIHCRFMDHSIVPAGSTVAGVVTLFYASKYLLHFVTRAVLTSATRLAWQRL